MQLSVLGALGPGIPHIINTKLLKQFTCLTYNNGRSGAVSVERNADGGGGEVWGLRCNSMFRDPAPKSESLPSSGDIIHCPSWKCSFVFGCGAPCSAELTVDQCCRKGQLPGDLEDRNCGASRPCLPLFDGAVLPAPAVFGNSRGQH